MAGTIRGIFGDFRLALALALLQCRCGTGINFRLAFRLDDTELADLQCRCGTGINFRGNHVRCGPFTPPLPVTTVLSPPTLTARLALPIPTARPPTTPLLRRSGTRLTAIPRLRTWRHEQLLAPFEQATANPIATPRPWPKRCQTLK
jgi:hypothetical protein